MNNVREFLTGDVHVFRSFNPNPYGVGTDPHNGDGNVITDENPLRRFSRKDEHVPSPFQLAQPAVKGTSEMCDVCAQTQTKSYFHSIPVVPVKGFQKKHKKPITTLSPYTPIVTK
jgi:hypothetical protein